MNPGGGGCSELRSHHCTPAWVTETDSVAKTNKKKRDMYQGVQSLCATHFQGLCWQKRSVSSDPEFEDADELELGALNARLRSLGFNSRQ